MVLLFVNTLCLCVFEWIQEVVLSPTASSYSMAQLTGSTEYNVRLQAIAGAQRSRHVNTVFTTSKVLFIHHSVSSKQRNLQ